MPWMASSRGFGGQYLLLPVTLFRLTVRAPARGTPSSPTMNTPPQLPLTALRSTVRLRARRTVTPIRLPSRRFSAITAPSVSIAPPSASTVLARKMPDWPLPVASFPVSMPRTDFSWLMPCWPLPWARTARTARPSVSAALTPFLRKPDTVSASIRTPVRRWPSAPVTQMPCPARAQALASSAPGVITVSGPAPRIVRSEVVTRTLPW